MSGRCRSWCFRLVGVACWMTWSRAVEYAALRWSYTTGMDSVGSSACLPPLPKGTSHRKVRNSVLSGPPTLTKSRTFTLSLVLTV